MPWIVVKPRAPYRVGYNIKPRFTLSHDKRFAACVCPCAQVMVQDVSTKQSPVVDPPRRSSTIDTTRESPVVETPRRSSTLPTPSSRGKQRTESRY